MENRNLYALCVVTHSDDPSKLPVLCQVLSRVGWLKLADLERFTAGTHLVNGEYQQVENVIQRFKVLVNVGYFAVVPHAHFSFAIRYVDLCGVRVCSSTIQVGSRVFCSTVNKKSLAKACAFVANGLYGMVGPGGDGRPYI